MSIMQEKRLRMQRVTETSRVAKGGGVCVPYGGQCQERRVIVAEEEDEDEHEELDHANDFTPSHRTSRHLIH